MKRTNTLALAAAILPSLLVLGSYLFLATEPRYILGIDRIMDQGADWRFPLTAGLHAFLENMAGPDRMHEFMPAGLRALQLLLHSATAGLLCHLLSQRGMHAAGAGLAGMLYGLHPLALAVAGPLDHTGLAMAMAAMLVAALIHARHTAVLGLALLAALSHPVGLLAPAFVWLFGHRPTKPLLAVSSALLISYIWLLNGAPERCLALAGHSLLTVIKGWQVGGFLDWSSLVAWERIVTTERSGILAGTYLLISLTTVLLAWKGELTGPALRRAVPVLVLAPLLVGLTPTGSLALPALGYSLPMLMVVAIFAGSILSLMLRGPTGEESQAEAAPPDLAQAAIKSLIIGFFVVGLPLVATVQQLPTFKDGLNFWRAQRAREEGSVGARYGLARAILYWQTHPRRIEGGNISQLSAVRAIEVLDNLFDELEARRKNGQETGLDVGTEAEARWMMSEAILPPYAQDFEVALAQLDSAQALAPEESKYTDALAEAKRYQPQYLQWVQGCQGETPARKEERRTILMRQASTLGQAGLIQSVPRKLRDAIRCAPQHPDGYLHLDRALQAIAQGHLLDGDQGAGMDRLLEARQLLEGLPTPLDQHAVLKSRLGFLIQNMPAPRDLDAKGIAQFRRDQRREAKPIWEQVLRLDNAQAIAWMNLAYLLLADEGDPPRAKAYLEKALSLDKKLIKRADVRQLLDTLTKRVKPDTVLPKAEIEPLPPTDGGPAPVDGATP